MAKEKVLAVARQIVAGVRIVQSRVVKSFVDSCLECAVRRNVPGFVGLKDVPVGLHELEFSVRGFSLLQQIPEVENLGESLAKNFCKHMLWSGCTSIIKSTNIKMQSGWYRAAMQGIQQAIEQVCPVFYMLNVNTETLETAFSSLRSSGTVKRACFSCKSRMAGGREAELKNLIFVAHKS